MNRLQAAEQLRRALQLFAATLTEEQALEIATVYPVWEAGRAYGGGRSTRRRKNAPAGRRKAVFPMDTEIICALIAGTATVLAAPMAQTLSQPYTLTWNSTGEVCKEWQLEDLWQLAYAIDKKVTSLVTYQ